MVYRNPGLLRHFVPRNDEKEKARNDPLLVIASEAKQSKRLGCQTQLLGCHFELVSRARLESVLGDAEASSVEQVTQRVGAFGVDIGSQRG